MEPTGLRGNLSSRLAAMNANAAAIVDIRNNNLFIADTFNNRIRMVTK